MFSYLAPLFIKYYSLYLYTQSNSFKSSSNPLTEPLIESVTPKPTYSSFDRFVHVVCMFFCFHNSFVLLEFLLVFLQCPILSHFWFFSSWLYECLYHLIHSSSFCDLIILGNNVVIISWSPCLSSVWFNPLVHSRSSLPVLIVFNFC